MKFKGLRGLVVWGVVFEEEIIEVTKEKDIEMLLTHPALGHTFHCCDKIEAEKTLASLREEPPTEEPPVKPVDGYDDMTLSQLKELVKNSGFAGSGIKSKQQLINVLREFEGEQDEA